MFQKQIASKHTDHHGFFILNTVVERLELTALAPFLPHIWGLLFLRLQVRLVEGQAGLVEGHA